MEQRKAVGENISIQKKSSTLDQNNGKHGLSACEESARPFSLKPPECKAVKLFSEKTVMGYRAGAQPLRKPVLWNVVYSTHSSKHSEASSAKMQKNLATT